MTPYLWDRTGPPEPEIQDLEQTLAILRYRPKENRLQWGRRPIPLARYLAIAACVLLCFAAVRWISPARRHAAGWTISGHRIDVGERLRTDGASRLTLESENVGQVSVEPNSELRVIELTPGQQRLELAHGRMHALIWAPPRQFVVDTPSAQAVDLGCQYDLSVDQSGDGFLTVQTGWVAFQSGKLESFIPAGAACRTTRAHGPGVPFFADAAPAFRDALEQFEKSGDSAALSRVLGDARPRDGITLWHLLSRVSASDRPRVFDRFARLVRLPPEVTRAKAVANDGPTLDLCWNALALDDAEWWRGWKQPWH